MAKSSSGVVVTLVVIAVVAALGAAIYFFGYDMLLEMHGRGRGMRGGQ